MKRRYDVKVTSSPYFRIGQVDQEGYGVFSGNICVIKGLNKLKLTKRQADKIAFVLNQPVYYEDSFEHMTQIEIDKEIEFILPG